MQPEYGVSQTWWMIHNVCKEIRQAKKAQYPILLVKMIGSGRIDTRILNEVEDYFELYFVKKRDCDGHQEVMKAMKKAGLELDRLRVCGVETDACVADTVEGLSRALPRTTIELVKSACNHYAGIQCRKQHRHTAKCRRKTAKEAMAWAKALPNVKCV
jgi:nicotinamidase-related amidase